MKKLNRVGEKYITNEGYKVEIIEYFGWNNCTLLFECGAIVQNINCSNLKRGKVLKPRVGERHINNLGQEFEIIKYDGLHSCTVQFSDGNIRENICYSEIKKGEVKNLFNPILYEIAYIGDGKYNSMKHTKAYSTWKAILERCYNKKYQEKQPTYKGCYICEEWYDFQNFAKWYEKNYNPETMDGWHLDKDILVKGNKIYSPNTCTFIPAEINCIFYKKISNIGDLPIGVVKSKHKFISQITKYNKKVYLGTYTTVDEAFKVYKVAKENYIKEIANKWKGKITDQVYNVLINYNIESICLSY
jgi:hypothetical protein